MKNYQPGLNNSLSGLRRPDGCLTQGQREPRTLRLRNAYVASALNLEGLDVLDLGCAEGLHSLYLSKSARQVVGIDHRPTVIEAARRTAKEMSIDNVSFEVGDIRNVGLDCFDTSYDLVVAWGFLHRIADIFSFLDLIGSRAKAISLEWRTPVFPFMSRAAWAYHAPAPFGLDRSNVGPISAAETGEKVEGGGGFFEPTPFLVKRILDQYGFTKMSLIGYEEGLSSQMWTVSLALARAPFSILKNLGMRSEIRGTMVPRRRVHALFQKPESEISLAPRAAWKLPDWDEAIKEESKRRPAAAVRSVRK